MFAGKEKRTACKPGGAFIDKNQKERFWRYGPSPKILILYHQKKATQPCLQTAGFQMSHDVTENLRSSFSH